MRDVLDFDMVDDLREQVARERDRAETWLARAEQWQLRAEELAAAITGALEVLGNPNGQCTIPNCSGCQYERQDAIAQLTAALAAAQPGELLERYADRMPAIRRVAREYGYAIGLHGSGSRDLDLIAVPWVDKARPADELVEAIRLAVDGVILEGIVNHLGFENPTHRPHGRKGWAIQIGGGLYIDLSVMPIAAQPGGAAANGTGVSER